jgi:hypothetical protein
MLQSCNKRGIDLFPAKSAQMGHGGIRLKHCILIFAVLIAASFAVSATPDSVVTGPYKVSFDIGLGRDSYNVTVPAPVIDETLGGEKRTLYSVNILNRTGDYRFILITITELEKGSPTIPTGSIIEMTLKSNDANDPRISSFKSSMRTIDGTDGAVASMTFNAGSGIIVDLFDAAYAPAIDPNRMGVSIASTYPWNEGTLQLLRTIHVGKAT